LTSAGGDFPVDIGLLSLRPSVVASDVGFEAVDLRPGAIERGPHSSERLVATPQRGARQMIARLVEPLVPLVGKPLAFVGMLVAVVGETFTGIGKLFALIGETVSFVGAMRLPAELASQLLGTHRIGVGTTRAGFSRRFLTTSRIRTIRSVVHGFSMRLASPSSGSSSAS
jgi:hypothetical protein